MKLLICRKCSDIFNLTKKVRSCTCGTTGGYYLDDGLNAEFFGGEYAMPVGFANSSLVQAIQQQPDSGLGKNFEAFIIPKVCPTMRMVLPPKRKEKTSARKRRTKTKLR